MIGKRLLSASAAALLAIGVLPAGAFAASAETKTVRIVIENNTVSKADGAAWEGTLIDTETALKDDSDMQSVVEDVLKAENIDYSLSGWGGLESINGLGADLGSYMSTLDDWFTSSGSYDYTAANGKLYDGAEIRVLFSAGYNYGSDIGSVWGDNDTSLASLTFSDGELDKAFESGTKEYTLTLTDVEEIKVTPSAKNKNFQVRTYKNTYLPETDGAEYKRSASIPVADGDTLYIGVGNSNWPSMNSGDDIKETVYTITIVSENTETDGEAAAKEVEDLIDAIGEVTLDSEDAINEAIAAYGRLTDDQKALVGNYSTLEAAIARLEELKAQNKSSASFEDMFNDTAAALAKTDAVIGNEWKAIGLARADKLPDAYKNSMADALRQYAATVSDGKFNARRSTENSKESVLAATLGIDPEKIAGQDILSAVKDKDYTAIQGINGQIWANIALTGVGKDSAYRDILLAAQLESGAFSFDNETEDVDITAMAITALALDDSAEAKAAVEKAVEWLSSVQKEDGSYGNCESTAQVIIALSSVGVDAVNDERFVKDGVSLMDGLALYYLGDGSFAHLEDGNADALATEQAFLALASYYRLTNEKSAIYDFSDVELKADTTEAPAPAEEPKGSNPATGAASGLAVTSVICLAFVLARKQRK